MRSISAKAHSAIAAVFCFCLLFSSTASAFAMVAHDMGSHDMHGRASLVNDMASPQQHNHSSGHNHSSSHVQQANDHYSSSNPCCDDGEGICASSCAAHCSTSVTHAGQCHFPLNLSANFDTEFELANLAFVDLAGPFKPPRS